MSKKYEKYLNKNLDEKLNILYIQNRILRAEIYNLLIIIAFIGLCIMPDTDDLFIIIADIVIKLFLLIAFYLENKYIKTLKKLIDTED